MPKTFSAIFGGAIAYTLLLLYAATVSYMIYAVRDCGGDAACTAKEFNDGIIHVVTIVGGLVSALVISKLTITTPGENPAIFRLAADASGAQNKFVTFLAILYICVWLIMGLAALVIGVMIYPGINDTLSDIGTTWLGLAVSAGYAYFGLDPSNP